MSLAVKCIITCIVTIILIYYRSLGPGPPESYQLLRPPLLHASSSTSTGKPIELELSGGIVHFQFLKSPALSLPQPWLLK